jgi:hypothetical protein
VSFSNPARQSLYTFDDCVGGDTLKVDASKRAMELIDPGVVRHPLRKLINRMWKPITLQFRCPIIPVRSFNRITLNYWILYPGRMLCFYWLIPAKHDGYQLLLQRTRKR